MPKTKQRRKKSRASGHGSVKTQPEAQPKPWQDNKLRSNFKSRPREVEKKYWRQ